MCSQISSLFSRQAAGGAGVRRPCLPDIADDVLTLPARRSEAEDGLHAMSGVLALTLPAVEAGLGVEDCGTGVAVHASLPAV
mmetsp:Transcript_17426/g.40703  ORF Transcript_17426/g.40703 Transcript_17426/m.40703 type:complete len:82 (+) Transcript_17426:52-297(+)